MPRSVQVVCRPEVASGFALAGLAAHEATTPEDGAVRMREALADTEKGVVLIEDAFYDRLPDDLRGRLGRRPVPLVVPFPGPAWEKRAAEPEAHIVELLRQVIGYRVRLR